MSVKKLNDEFITRQIEMHPQLKEVSEYTDKVIEAIIPQDAQLEDDGRIVVPEFEIAKKKGPERPASVITKPDLTEEMETLIFDEDQEETIKSMNQAMIDVTDMMFPENLYSRPDQIEFEVMEKPEETRKDLTPSAEQYFRKPSTLARREVQTKGIKKILGAGLKTAIKTKDPTKIKKGKRLALGWEKYIKAGVEQKENPEIEQFLDEPPYMKKIREAKKTGEIKPTEKTVVKPIMKSGESKAIEIAKMKGMISAHESQWLAQVDQYGLGRRLKERYHRGQAEKAETKAARATTKRGEMAQKLPSGGQYTTKQKKKEEKYITEEKKYREKAKKHRELEKSKKQEGRAGKLEEATKKAIKEVKKKLKKREKKEQPTEIKKGKLEKLRKVLSKAKKVKKAGKKGEVIA